ncbi:MAG: hypothetical protein K2X47_13060, partial [Bdellovibrionales bacterium]|nr:hypothetical protein [Bdellovibrionales bacterium]
PPLCNQKSGPELSIANVAMNLDRSEIVYEDGAILSVPAKGGLGSVDLYELSQNVLGVLLIDRALISGGAKVKEIRVYFRNDNNYIYNTQGTPICRWVPQAVGMPSLVVEVNATPYEINRASRVTFSINPCDLVLQSDGDCSLRKTYRGFLQ